ncbi:hypothetical protein [Rhodohalobacter barkolensis]|uniref:Uncharacterized protein n=1 Tax=Rhodohalobacter barkolensis TaxID=2053187 RepID=A0A2N0VEA9_9BACT|nr:hypothetical protein [Rhodohalobacter barkolensis]PKD42534.1 hypothetical protein CWD77_14065 [Rhodohalobacter barkolensis]
MMDKTKLVRFIESELDGFKLKFLFKDKKLLNEGKFEEFARAILKRSKKSFSVMFAVALCFVSIGVLYQSNLLVPGSPLWIGLSYIFLGVSFLVISTKEYYQVRGSMTLLLYLLEADEEHEPQITSELETV